MTLIKPEHVYKNVKSASRIPLNLTKLEIFKIILILDINVRNNMMSKIIESFEQKLNILLIYKYEGGEPQTSQLNLFLKRIHNLSFDAIVGIGGGSTLDFTKAASVLCQKGFDVDSGNYQGVTFEVDKKVTCVCIPTTAGSGAETTKSAVMFNPNTNIKRGINHLKVLPDIVFLVPSILDNLPEGVFYPSLFDGVTHAFESLVGKSSTKQTSRLAKKSLRIYRKQLNRKYSKDKYHKKVLLASHFAGQAICNSETGPIHALSYPLSEFLKMSHGQAISLILPRMISFYNDYDNELIEPLLSNLGFYQVNSLIDKIDGLNSTFVLPNIKVRRDMDINSFVLRSMELHGAIDNSPIKWNKDYSLKVYNEVFESLGTN